MDVSGDEDNKNYKYLGIVIGTNESIMSLSNDIGPFPERFSRVKPQDREKIIKKLIFDSKNRMAFCVRLERQKIIKEISNSRIVSKYRKIGKKKLYNTFEYVIMQQVNKKIREFITVHGVSMNQLIIQGDKDSTYFANAGNFRHQERGAAYRLSDYVAWCNNKNCAPPTVVELDFIGEIPQIMKKILKLN